MMENTNQKNSKYGHFPRSNFSLVNHSAKQLIIIPIITKILSLSKCHSWSFVSSKITLSALHFDFKKVINQLKFQIINVSF